MDQTKVSQILGSEIAGSVDIQHGQIGAASAYNDNQAFAYVAVKPCGCALSVLLDRVGAPLDRHELETWKEDVFSQGFQIETWTISRVKSKFGHCDLHKPVVQQEMGFACNE